MKETKNRIFSFPSLKTPRMAFLEVPFIVTALRYKYRMNMNYIAIIKQLVMSICCQGLYQIGELQARSWMVGATSVNGCLPSRKVSQVVQRQLGFSSVLR